LTGRQVASVTTTYFYPDTASTTMDDDDRGGTDDDDELGGRRRASDQPHDQAARQGPTRLQDRRPQPRRTTRVKATVRETRHRR